MSKYLRIKKTLIKLFREVLKSFYKAEKLISSLLKKKIIYSIIHLNLISSEIEEGESHEEDIIDLSGTLNAMDISTDSDGDSALQDILAML